MWPFSVLQASWLIWIPGKANTSVCQMSVTCFGIESERISTGVLSSSSTFWSCYSAVNSSRHTFASLSVLFCCSFQGSCLYLRINDLQHFLELLWGISQSRSCNTFSALLTQIWPSIQSKTERSEITHSRSPVGQSLFWLNWCSPPDWRIVEPSSFMQTL